jgi:membrane protease YdiL (CAAX protease family)
MMEQSEAGTPLSNENHVLRFLLVLLLSFITPPALIFFGVIPFAFRFYVLLLSNSGLAIYAWATGYGLRELGIRRDTFLSSLLVNGAITALVAAALLAGYAYGSIRAPTIPSWSAFFPLYVAVFCPAQEFACRGVMFAELNRTRASAPVQICASALVYAFIHIIYHDPLILVATLAIGIAWGAAYWFRPNLLTVSLSHAILGLISILVGLV